MAELLLEVLYCILAADDHVLHRGDQRSLITVLNNAGGIDLGVIANDLTVVIDALVIGELGADIHCLAVILGCNALALSVVLLTTEVVIILWANVKIKLLSISAPSANICAR